MIKKPRSKAAADSPSFVQDEPGAENRFMRGIRKALKTPHKPHKDEPKRKFKRKRDT